ncbi:MAG: DUF4405 domain-containing protein [Rhizobacter sp.]
MAALRPPAINPLPRWQRLGLYISIGTLTLSGLLWLLVHYTWGAGTGELPHPLEVWMIRLHGASAMACLFFVGIVAGWHVPRGWKLARQRATGVSVLSGLAFLALSGYALYYFAPETVRTWVGNIHAAAGAAVAVLLAWHSRIARR